jgi:hypothetical protein
MFETKVLLEVLSRYFVNFMTENISANFVYFKVPLFKLMFCTSSF